MNLTLLTEKTMGKGKTGIEKCEPLATSVKQILEQQGSDDIGQDQELVLVDLGVPVSLAAKLAG